MDLAFSPNGMHLAYARSGGPSEILRVPGLTTEGSLSNDGYYSIAYSPDGRAIAATCAAIEIWDVTPEGGPSRLWQLSSPTTAARCVAWAPDGSEVAAGGMDGTVELWQLQNGERRETFKAHSAAVNGIAFSPAGGLLATGGNDKTLKLWTTAGGGQLWLYDGFTSAVKAVGFTEDGSLVAACDSSTAVVLRVADRAMICQASRENTNLSACAISPDGQLLAVGALNTVVLYRVADGAEVQQLRGQLGPVLAVEFSPDGKFVATCGGPDSVKVWRVVDGCEIGALYAHMHEVNAVDVSADGRVVLSGSSDNTIKLWRLTDGKCLRTITDLNSRVTSLAAAPDGLAFAAADDSGTVAIFRVADGELLRSFRAHQSTCRALDYSPDGRLLATGGKDVWDGTPEIKIWRMDTGENVQTLTGHLDGVRALEFSPDGGLLASGSYDDTVRIWRVSDWSLVRTLRGNGGDVKAVGFAPDSQTLASGHYNGRVLLWRVSDGALLRTMVGHAMDVQGVAFAPDGFTLASVGGIGDTKLCLWSVADGALLQTYGWAGFGLEDLAFSPNSQFIVYGCNAEAVVVIGNPYAVRAAASPGDAKASGASEYVDLGGAITSAIFEDCFYVQDPQRSGGIRVEGPFSPAVGTVVRVMGASGVTAAEECFIRASSIALGDPREAVPVQMPTRSLGGGDFVSACGAVSQRGVRGSHGLNNIGLLVRLTGRVGFIDPAGDYFTLSDGSDVLDSAGTSGVRVQATAMMPFGLSTGDYVSVTGVSSCYKVGDALYPQVRVRSPADTQVVSP